MRDMPVPSEEIDRPGETDDVTTATIERVARTRASLRRSRELATQAILDVLSERSDEAQSIADVYQQAEEKHHVSDSALRPALWVLLHRQRVTLADDYRVRLATSRPQ
jgi:hypothetical protein